MKNLRSLFEISPRTVGDLVWKSKMISIGGGECVTEFYDYDGNFLFEVCQENGTRCSEEEHEWSDRNALKEEDDKRAKLLPLDERINLRGQFGPFIKREYGDRY